MSTRIVYSLYDANGVIFVVRDTRTSRFDLRKNAREFDLIKGF